MDNNNKKKPTTTSETSCKTIKISYGLEKEALLYAESRGGIMGVNNLWDLQNHQVWKNTFSVKKYF